MKPGDFVIVNDIIGCIQTMHPLRLLCQDGVVRELEAEPSLIITGQQFALLLAEKAMGVIRGGGAHED